MNMEPPKIIQGGMGFGISGWTLARAVSRLGQLGVVSGTALDCVFTRRLQDGDPGGHVRRAMEQFPFQEMARRVMDRYYIPGGLAAGEPYRKMVMHDLEGRREPQELCIIGNFVEVFLAREGHDGPVGINYLEKIQIPHLPSIYGAMLAGVAVVIMGAGIPLAVPPALEALTRHEPVEYPVYLLQADGKTETFKLQFDPARFMEGGPVLPELKRPDFLPIVSSETLASVLLRKAPGRIDGFIVESNVAGGHNAPPRGMMTFNAEAEPVYGPRDAARMDKFRDMGLPFWLAGAVGTPEGLRYALAEGAAGIQAGTAFALCTESGLLPEIREDLLRGVLAGEARVFTDFAASPTGFPFKVASLKGSLSEKAVYKQRRRVCDIGFLRQAFRREDGTIAYRCPAEPVAAYVAKGGSEEETVGRKCLCNALAANMGMAQKRPDGSYEKPLVTMGDTLTEMGRFCPGGRLDFSAAEVVATLLGKG